MTVRTYEPVGGKRDLCGIAGWRRHGQRGGTVWSRAAAGLLAGVLTLLAASGCAPVVGAEATADDHGDTRADATLATARTPVAGELETADDVDYFKVAVNEDSVRIMAFTDQGAAGNPVVRIEGLGAAATNDGHVAWGNLPSPRPEYVHIRVSGDRPLSYSLVVSLVAAVDPRAGDRFDIELRYLGTEPTASQQLAFAGAARFWEQAIVAGLPDLPVPTSEWKCREDDPSLFGEYIDDLVIFVRVEEIGGAAGAVAQSTICARRAEADGGLPFIGAMSFSAAEMEALETHSYLERLAMRQIAVVLGFGLLWDEAQFALLEDPSVEPDGSTVGDRDTHFAGEQARAAFATSGGGYPGAAVPVENDTEQYGPGALDLYWRESVFGTELMTTELNAANAPVSAVTLASLADLGYEVDPHRAEPYALAPAGDSPGEPEAIRVVGSSAAPTEIAVAALPARLIRFLNAGAGSH